jgi:hypothetical protein
VPPLKFGGVACSPARTPKRTKPGRVWRHLGARLYRLPPS